jgi:hypothetical protein
MLFCCAVVSTALSFTQIVYLNLHMFADFRTSRKQRVRPLLCDALALRCAAQTKKASVDARATLPALAAAAPGGLRPPGRSSPRCACSFHTDRSRNARALPHAGSAGNAVRGDAARAECGGCAAGGGIDDTRGCEALAGDTRVRDRTERRRRRICDGAGTNSVPGA